MQSYDKGENWMVIQSQIGGCPITGSAAGGGQGTCKLLCIFRASTEEPFLLGQLDFTVPIPKDAPSGPAIFAWTWYNRVGNREMYSKLFFCAFCYACLTSDTVNCASLTIESPYLSTLSREGKLIYHQTAGTDSVHHSWTRQISS